MFGKFTTFETFAKEVSVRGVDAVIVQLQHLKSVCYQVRTYSIQLSRNAVVENIKYDFMEQLEISPGKVVSATLVENKEHVVFMNGDMVIPDYILEIVTYE